MDLDSHLKRQGIGTLSENSLHAGLIDYYTQPGDELEVNIDGLIIDIVRGDLLIEVQTRQFSAIKRKLIRLIEHHPLRLVFPIAQEKWIVRMTPEHQQISRRKSPRRGRIEHLFSEMIRIPDLILSPNFSLDVLLIKEEEIQIEDGRGSWRRQGRSISDRRLIQALESRLFLTPEDFHALLPGSLPRPFTNQELAKSLGITRGMAQKMTYCLRQMGRLTYQGRRGKNYLYSEENI